MKPLFAKDQRSNSAAGASVDGQLLLNSIQDLRSAPVSGGMCFPKGAFTASTDASARNRFVLKCPFDTVRYVAETVVLDRWSDGSVRWALVNAVPAGSLHQPVRQSSPLDALEPSEAESYLNSGAVKKESVDGTCYYQIPVTVCPAPEFQLSPRRRTSVRFLENRIELRSADLDADQPCEQVIEIEPQLFDDLGNMMSIRPGAIAEESAGEIRQVFLIPIQVVSAPWISLQLRMIWWPLLGYLEVETRLRNTRRARHAGGLWDLGDPGSWRFSGLELWIRSNDSTAASTMHWTSEIDLPWRCVASRDVVSIVQSGSGGPWWSSRNHAETPSERGYTVHAPEGVLRGYRAEPTLIGSCGNEHTAVMIPEFWQQFPAQIAWNDGQFVCGVFPRSTGCIFELQGGEQKTTRVRVRSFRSEPHDFSDSIRWMHRPGQLIPTTSAIANTETIPWFPGELSSTPAGTRLSSYLSEAMSGEYSLTRRREKIDEYGWRNYGDVPADHEQTHYAGSNTVISHYNNQFDMIFGGIQQLLNAGDPMWLNLFDPLARHVMDIDLYHTNEDRAVFNGGLFWHTDHYVDAATSTHRTYSVANQKPGQPYGGGPGNEHNYTTGLLYYYLLTGHPEARESVVMLADWVIAMDDGRNTILGVLDGGPTGFASATVSSDFHGPGRGAGNSINALMDGWLLTRDPQYCTKAEELIRRCVHPEQDLEALHLADAEGHWSYTVFLTSLSRYLLLKLEAGQTDSMYSYARAVMSHYGRWMVVHECRTLSHPEKLQYPTEAWAAQDFRKANVLRLAAACEDDPAQAEAMRLRACQLNDDAWADLLSFGEAHLSARCLSILMTEGLRDVFHRVADSRPLPAGTHPLPEVQWAMFVPQKARVRKLLKRPVHLAASLLKVLSPHRCFAAWDALRRQF